MDTRLLPGADLISQGVADLEKRVVSVPALVVSIGRPKLQQLGFELPDTLSDPEKRLYLHLRELYGDAAHSRYNALIRRLVSFEHTAACAS